MVLLSEVVERHQGELERLHGPQLLPSHRQAQVLSDGLACFRAVTIAGCSHEAIVTGGKHPSELPQFRWVNTLLGNLKTSFNGTFHAFNFDKYARRYLGGYCFRFNRRFSLAAMTERIANAVCCCMPCTERGLRVAEAYG